MDESCSKFNEGSIRIPSLPEYVDSREETKESILPHPTTDYELPILEVPPKVQIKGCLLGCIEDMR